MTSCASDNPTSTTANPEAPQGNRLAGEVSPYLLQHKDNPVDWYPWGEEAFKRAREEDKPIFLSIGYATCHWCHVMEHESFEDSEVAALMNSTFINIKVDREERPDIDQVYMAVCQMLTGSGGWPLTIVMTPDKRPIFAATYIPKETNYGRIGMLELIPQISDAWTNKRAQLDESADSILENLNRISESTSEGSLPPQLINTAYAELANRYDSTEGGFGVAPKFPTPHNLIFLTRYWSASGDTKALSMVEHTLRQMRRGGIYDHIGFGFHRYSTDREWLVPHFEKMLYDQAMLVLAYTEAFEATSQPEFATVVRELLTYVQRDMTSSEGGFYSAEDADSEGVEGKFNVWSIEEVNTILGPKDAKIARTVWNLEASGNFSDEASGEESGLNIPHLAQPLAESASELGVDLDVLSTRIEQIRKKLFAARELRIHPLKDDKILADWNGLMIAAMARAGSSLGDDSYIKAAEKAGAFVMKSMRRPDGRLLHRHRNLHGHSNLHGHRNNETDIPAFLDDYAFLTWGFLELYAATLDAQHLETALELEKQTIALFADQESGGLFFSAMDNEQLLVRQKEIYDGAIPSGNSVAVANLLRLSRLTGDLQFKEKAKAIADSFASQVSRAPSAHSQLMAALLSMTRPSLEVVIVGPTNDPVTSELIRAAKSEYHPDVAIVHVPTGPAGKYIRKLAPFVESYTAIEGKPTAYVCRDFSCQLPSSDPAEIVKMMAEPPANQDDNVK